MYPARVGRNSVVIVPNIRSILPLPRGYPANPGSGLGPVVECVCWGWSVAALLFVQSAELFFVAADVAGDGLE